MITPPEPAQVTCVIASRNRRDDLLLSLPRHEAPVVLVDNASTDDTVAVVGRVHPEVRVVPLPENLGAVARTIGVEYAGTPFVAFTDDDSWWAPGDLARAVAVMQAHPRLGLLAARILVGPEDRLDPVCTEMAGSPLGTEPDLPGPSLLGFVACAALVRVEAFTAVGGFDRVVRFPARRSGSPSTWPPRAGGWPTSTRSPCTTTPHRAGTPTTSGRPASGAAGCSPRCCGTRCPRWPGSCCAPCGPGAWASAGWPAPSRGSRPRCGSAGCCPPPS